MALYTEGATDNRFLPLIVQRTAEELLLQRASQVVDVLPVQVIQGIKQESRAEAILQAAKQSQGYQLLLIHSDADDRSASAALSERIQPGLDLVAQQPVNVELCRDLVPIVPVTMIEAWMLADAEALCEIMRTEQSLQDLTIPTSPDAIERIAYPKDRLAQILRNASAYRSRRRRREHTVSELYEPLGQQIDLSKLGRLSAYQTFQEDLASALRFLHYIR
jgi:hypothetical protein